MKLQKYCAYILIALSGMMTISCGGGGADAIGNYVNLSTSRITTNANPSSIDADLVVDIDPSTGLPFATGHSIHKDTVSVSITSTVTVTPALPVQVHSVTVSYIAKNGGPPLANATYGIGTTFDAGTTLTIAVDVATLNQKVDTIYPAWIVSPATTLDYDVTLTFDISEVPVDVHVFPATHTTIHCTNFADS
jgi:hypothetical protein